jgi:hypothetical protein
MIDNPVSRTGRRAVRAALLALAALSVAYALSDHPWYGGEPGFGGWQMAIAAAGVAIAACALLPAPMAGGALLFALSSLAMLGFVELAAELMLGARYRPIYQPDERLIFKFIPGRRSVMTHPPVNGGHVVAHRINAQGFRGEDLQPAAQTARVVVYGDSFIHAFYSADEETFVAQLGAALAERRGAPVEVVNGGVSSYGPDQVALKMEDELPRLRPDLVIVAVFAGNDYGDLMRNKMFRLDGGGRLVPNPWRLDAKVRAWLELSQRESILKRALRGALGARADAPAAADAMNAEFLLREAEKEYRDFVIAQDNVVRNTHVDYYSADVSLTPGSESAKYKVRLMHAVLERIRDTAARAGVSLAFLFIPHPLDAAGADDWGSIDRARFPAYEPRNQIAPLEASATVLGVPFVTLYDLFRAADAAKLYYRGGDDHWNAAGQRLAAHATADYIQRTGLLRSRAAGTALGTAGAPSTRLPAR